MKVLHSLNPRLSTLFPLCSLFLLPIYLTVGKLIIAGLCRYHTVTWTVPGPTGVTTITPTTPALSAGVVVVICVVLTTVNEDTNASMQKKLFYR